MSALRLGIVGTGHMAAQMARAARVAGLRVSAVLSRQPERARVFCAAHCPQAQPKTDLDALFAACDAVYIATPPDRHRSAALAAIAAGRPVLCEKPLTPSAAETEEVLSAARSRSVPVMEAIWTLALPAYRAFVAQARSLPEAGPKRLSFDFSYPLLAPPDSHYFDPVTGGVLLDRAVYGYAAAIACLGPVRSQTAHVTRDATGLDRGAVLHLDHALGGQSLLSLSFDCMGGQRLELASAQGLAVLGPPALAAETLAWSDAPTPGPHGAAKGLKGLKGLLTSAPAMRRVKRLAELRRTRTLGYGPARHAPLLRAFAEMIASGAPDSPIVPMALSQEIAWLTQQARAAR